MRATHPEETRILALFDALLNELHGLLQILPVNRILDLVVAAVKHRILPRRHDGDFRLSQTGLRQVSQCALCAEHSEQAIRNGVGQSPVLFGGEADIGR